MHRLINAYDEAQIRGIAEALASQKNPLAVQSRPVTSIRRRQVIAGLAMAPFISRYPLASKILGRLVIIGGGFAGATLARFAKALEPAGLG